MKIPRVGDKTTASSSTQGDATSSILILVIACLVLTILILGSPEAAQLTPEQTSLQGPVTAEPVHPMGDSLSHGRPYRTRCCII
jgi:hypothetical protein